MSTVFNNKSLLQEKITKLCLGRLVRSKKRNEVKGFI